MRDDLLDAQACIDWTEAQLPAFTKRIESWLRDSIEIRIEETPVPATHNRVVAIEKDSLPLSVNVEFGAYINTIRSSLDILATSLAARSGVCKPEDAYFPVARSETAFNAGNYKGSKFVKGLPGAERAIIEALKPYKGGNEPLYALHQLDIMRKHRRLIEVDLIPQGASASKGGFISTEAFREDEKTVLGFIRKRPPDSNGKFVAKISFSVVDTKEPKQVIASLGQFASLAHSIIKLFDTP